MLYNLVVIGGRAPEIPWSSVVGLRNLVTHEYFNVDLEVIREIVETSLDPLEAAVRRLLADA